MYVEKCSPKIKRFDSTKDLIKFTEEFWAKHPEHLNPNSDYWIDYAVTGVTGDVKFFTDGITVT